MAFKSGIFEGTLSIVQRTSLALEQFSWQTFFGKSFGTVWDDLGSVLRVVCKGKSGDFVEDIIE